VAGERRVRGREIQRREPTEVKRDEHARPFHEVLDCSVVCVARPSAAACVSSTHRASQLGKKQRHPASVAPQRSQTRAPSASSRDTDGLSTTPPRVTTAGHCELQLRQSDRCGQHPKLCLTCSDPNTPHVFQEPTAHAHRRQRARSTANACSTVWLTATSKAVRHPHLCHFVSRTKKKPEKNRRTSTHCAVLCAQKPLSVGLLLVYAGVGGGHQGGIDTRQEVDCIGAWCMLKFTSVWLQTNDSVWEKQNSRGKLEGCMYTRSFLRAVRSFAFGFLFRFSVPRAYSHTPTDDAVDFIRTTWHAMM
jgi:hypothetical protein